MDEYPIEVPEPRPARVDWVLQRLVTWANEKAIELDITLHVGGLVVTGTLVGGAEYFAAIGQSVAKIGRGDESGDSPSSLQKAITELGGHYAQRPFDERLDAGEDLFLPQHPEYIHLRNAHWIMGSQIAPTDQGVMWRGRLASVDGFVIGSISVGEPE